MSVFFTLLGKIIPLYFSVFLGFISTYKLKCDKETIAKILLFILAPLIVFNATVSVKLNLQVLFLPISFFIFSTILAFTLLYLFKKIYSDNTANLLAFSTSTGNTGNIGIPLAILFLEPKLVDIFIFSILASILYQNSVGYYITAKGNFSAKESFKKVLKLPVIYAFILGIILNLNEIKIPDMFLSYSDFLKGTYAILGMMLVGMGMEKFRSSNSFDIKFISFTLIIKFILWPVATLLFIYFDKNFIHFLDKDFYMIMFLFSIVPLAGNTVTVATILNVKPEKMSMAVFISTIISLFYIPFVLYVYMN
ncbi:AEC family transporter [Arcobacter lacus]|uniref:Transporter n=1 Tax=Arcobacter lacus TaxID=1912876 RepID=A0ABX5JN49_9BACT|nr:AEC family transporter [Arcobacter lacus]MCT7908194.1 AEC family transporter [Arcobacter lacus]MCT7912017.1 AEC family transporter [Arcobacter lacus]PUE67554.1 transporter [Arcobacter lacus]